jgi:serine/threonine protein kinase/Flp pilus assembly protein TadD
MSQPLKSAKEIFLAALDLEPAERAALLDAACTGDVALRRQVEALLRVHDEPDSLLDGPRINLGLPDNAVAGPDPTLDQPVTEAPGTVIGPYKLLQQIGVGGMGVVYMAEQTEPVERRVALKIIKPGMDTRQVIARFEAEEQALAMMDHPNIAKVLDAGATDSGRPYFVMELVKGVPITQYCDEHHLTPRQRLELFVPVCHAVQHAHQKGIIHRDLKPTNVLVAEYDDRPVPKIIDFGVAKAIQQRLTEKSLFTELGQVVGTIDYMSPEQAKLNQLDIDTRSDIYSLGVLLYELLTGETPLDRQRLRSAAFDEMLRIIREEEPPRPSLRLSSSDSLPSIAANRQTEPKKLSTLVRGELDWIVMKALEKDRARRYETANGFAADIERYLSDEPVLACPPSAAYRLRKFARRNKGRLAVAGLMLFLLILLGGGLGWVLRDREARREQAVQQARESLTRARQWAGENKLALAREELAAAKGRMASDRAALGDLLEEIEALETELATYERFLDLVEQAHEAEFPQPGAMLREADSARMAAAPPRLGAAAREPAKAVPFLLEALSCYGILEQDDWNARLEGGVLEKDQVARVRRTAYEELLWLGDDAVRRGVDHCSGRKLSPAEAAREGLTYLSKAESASPLTPAFYRIRAACRKALGAKDQSRQDEALARQTPGVIALDHYLLALAAYDAGNKVEGVKQCEAALRAEPTHYWSLIELGSCLCDLGQGSEDFAGAARVFTGCILHRPDHAAAYLGRGVAHFRLRRPTEAEADFRQALRLRPDYPQAHNNLCSALAAEGRHAEAESECREALRLRPDFSEALVNLGASLSNQGKHVEAEAEYRRGLRLKPDSPGAHYNLGNALSKQGRQSEAEAEYRQALRLQPDFPEALVNLGWILADRGNYAEAEAEYRQALRLQPDFPEAYIAHCSLGFALWKQGRNVEAEAECREAMRLRPGFAGAYFNLGLVLYWGNKTPAAAERFYAEAFAANPQLTDDPSNQLRYNAACYAALAGCGEGDGAKLDDAERTGLRQQALDWLRAELAVWTTVVQKQPDEARVNFERTLRHWQQDADFAGVRGDALAKLPEAERQAWQQLWVDVEQTLRADGFLQAMTQWRLGNSEEAYKWYFRAAQATRTTTLEQNEVGRLREKARGVLGIPSEISGPIARGRSSSDIPHGAVLFMDFERDTIAERGEFVFMRDLSGCENHGVGKRMAYAAKGKIGGGLACQNGTVHLPKGLLTNLPEYTVAGWVYRKATTGALQIYSQYGSGGGIVYEIVIRNGGFIELGAWHKNTPDNWMHASTPPASVPDDRWFFLAVRFQESAGKKENLTVTIDDRSYRLPLQQVAYDDLADTAQLGGGANAIGALDELVIYPRALSDAAVDSLYRRAAKGGSLDR